MAPNGATRCPGEARLFPARSRLSPASATGVTALGLRQPIDLDCSASALVAGRKSNADCKPNQRGNVMNSQTLHQRGAMRFDRLHAELQRVGNHSRRVSTCDEPEDFQLPAGKKRKRL